MCKPIVMVSAACGYNDLLNSIYNSLKGKFDVKMSCEGSCPYVCKREGCEQAIKECDFFLGLITCDYGDNFYGGLSRTHYEFKIAVNEKKLRWFLVADRIVFARTLLHKLHKKEDKDSQLLNNLVVFARTLLHKLHKKEDKDSQLLNNLANNKETKCSVLDQRVINMYDMVALERKDEGEEPSVKWVQRYTDDRDAVFFVESQFSRFQDLMKILKDHNNDRKSKQS